MHVNPATIRARTVIAPIFVWGAVLLFTACGTGKQGSPRHVPSLSAKSPTLPGLIVFRRFFDPGHHTGAIFTVRPDGRGARQLSHPPGGSVDSDNGPPGFTPDGKTLVFDRTDASGTGSLWSVRTDGGGEHRLRSLPGLPGDGWPTVSPDGAAIAVARAWGKPDSYQDLKTGLYVLRVDGSAPRLVASFGYRADVGGATWSPDGRELVFSAHNNGPGLPSDASALFVVSATGHGLRRLTPWGTSGQVASPAFSPDGKLVLFTIKPEGQDFGGNLYTIHADGSHRRQLTAFPVESNLAAGRWSPDGKWIVFANTGVGGSDDVFLMRVDGSGISPLTRTTAWESAVNWIP